MPSPENPASTTCSVCGSPLRRGAEGPCPRCLLSLAASGGVLDEEDEESMLFGAFQRRKFGDYELIEEIARGGMGMVFRARQLSLNREVALKLILSGEMAGRTAREMFRTEAKAAAGLHHANIVTV